MSVRESLGCCSHTESIGMPFFLTVNIFGFPNFTNNYSDTDTCVDLYPSIHLALSDGLWFLDILRIVKKMIWDL